MKTPNHEPMRQQYLKAKRALVDCARKEYYQNFDHTMWCQRMVWHRALVKSMETQWRAYRRNVLRS